MYHAHFKGTHYEAGFRWGSLLFQHKNIITDHLPFEITTERINYALSCLPVYEKFYPEILDEIQGLAKGQHCDVRILQAVLFGMYAIPPACCCSCFSLADENTILLGRNSDFLPDLEKLNMNVIYRLSDGAYSFTGNTTAFVEMEDGINEYGLAIGLTSVFPTVRKPGFNAGILLRYLLEKCQTVSEALSCIRRLPAGSAHTLTLADSSGEIAAVESNAASTAISVKKQPIPLSANYPHTGKTSVYATNRFHLPEMKSFNLPEETLSEADAWFAETRYQTLLSVLSNDGLTPSLAFAQKLLSGKYGFLCQYDRNTGKDTVWSVIYDLKKKRIYRCEKNPGRGKYKEDTRFQFL